MIRGLQKVPTPPKMRNLALACVFLATFVGLFSAVEAMSMGGLEQRRDTVVEDSAAMPFVTDPQMTVAMADAQISAIHGMKTPRALILASLSVCCAVAWISATRLIRFDGLPREGMRRMLSGSLIAAAFLRVIDGAQSLVIAQRGVAAAAPFVSKQPGLDAQSAELAGKLFPVMISGGVIAITVLIAGGMLLLGQYFRSEKVKQVVALQDQQLE